MEQQQSASSDACCDPVAQGEVMPETIHSAQQYENNGAEQSNESTRVKGPWDVQVQIGQTG